MIDTFNYFSLSHSNRRAEYLMEQSYQPKRNVLHDKQVAKLSTRQAKRSLASFVTLPGIHVNLHSPTSSDVTNRGGKQHKVKTAGDKLHPFMGLQYHYSVHSISPQHSSRNRYSNLLIILTDVVFFFCINSLGKLNCGEIFPNTIKSSVFKSLL